MSKPDTCLYEVEGQEAVALRVYGAAQGALALNLIRVGDKLGLYRIMKEIGPCTSVELAKAGQVKERWCREWLHQQAASRLICTDYTASKFWLSPAQCDVLANEKGSDSSPYFAAGIAQSVVGLLAESDDLCTCFKTGLGRPYDNHGLDCAMGTCRDLGTWIRHNLRGKLESIPDLGKKLQAGCMVADVGCGGGEAICTLAAAYPNSTFHGYDNSLEALRIARAHATDKALSNVTFKDASKPDELLPESPTYDFVMVNDALHDMARPDLCLRAIRVSMKADGLFFIVDMSVLPGGPAANILSNPMAPLMWGFSVPLCMSSALSTPDGMGLGTLGFDTELAERMCREVGFTHFERLPWEHPFNAFYLVKP